jgi:transposase-like protein
MLRDGHRFCYDSRNQNHFLKWTVAMPQLQLPFFTEGITLINQNIGFIRRDTTITYVHGNLPVFTHDIDDIQSFRMITSQLYVNGSATQAEICRAFGVSKISVLRSVKLYRSKGMAGFFAARICRGPAVLTPPVLDEVQELLDAERSIPEIADELGSKADTLHKAVRAGKVHQPQKKRLESGKGRGNQ